MRNLFIKNKNKLKISAVIFSALIILFCAACSSEKPEANALTSDDTRLQNSIAETLQSEFSADTVEVEMIKSATDKNAVIVNIIFDDSNLTTRDVQDDNFVQTFEIIKNIEGADSIEALHVNYTSGETLYAIYDLPLFDEATSDNLSERVSILDLTVIK